VEAYLSSLLPAARQEERQDMLAYMAKETRPDGELFSDRELVDHANFLLFAAHDTTTSTLTHMMYYLARYPEWQQRIREEGRAVNPAGPLTYEDLPALPLLEAAFFESQRLQVERVDEGVDRSNRVVVADVVFHARRQHRLLRTRRALFVASRHAIVPTESDSFEILPPGGVTRNTFTISERGSELGGGAARNP
jgi:hypothetical protein